MTPNLYDAWITAGNTLQPVGDWVATYWPALTTASALTFALWALPRYIRGSRDDYRTRNDHAAAQRITRTEDRPEPGTPGNDEQLLQQCHQILDATNTRKENEKP
jgi:hypothetical protein